MDRGSSYLLSSNLWNKNIFEWSHQSNSKTYFFRPHKSSFLVWKTYLRIDGNLKTRGHLLPEQLSMYSFSQWWEKTVASNRHAYWTAFSHMLLVNVSLQTVIWQYSLLLFRSSLRGCPVKKGIFKNFANFTGENLCWSLF